MEQNLDFLSVIIRNREKIVFEGDKIFAVSSVNKLGPFDVLPEHSNFICLCQDFIKIIRKNGEVVDDIKIESGVMRVSGNIVKIFLGLAAPIEETNIKE